MYSVPIEKTSGCNHIKCWKVGGGARPGQLVWPASYCALFQCRHDFCWMCLDKWNKHSSATGGYFECNRYKLIEKVQEMLDQNQKVAYSGCITCLSHNKTRLSCYCLCRVKITSSLITSSTTMTDTRITCTVYRYMYYSDAFPWIYIECASPSLSLSTVGEQVSLLSWRKDGWAPAAVQWSGRGWSAVR